DARSSARSGDGLPGPRCHACVPAGGRVHGVAGAGGTCCRCAGLHKTRRGAYAHVMRLVSLLPSATEIVYALGLGDQLVGVTFECDEPASARADKAVVVGGLDTRGMSPGEIDEYVRGRLAAGGDLYTLHERALADLPACVAGRRRPTVAVVEWVDPPFTAGHWVPDLVTAAGGIPVAARPGEPSITASWAEIAAARPDLVVVAPCGCHLDGAAE